MVYADLRRLNEAIEYKLKCLEILSEDNSDNIKQTQEILARILTELGYLYFELKSYDDSLVCFNRAVNIYRVVFGEKDERIPIILNKFLF